MILIENRRIRFFLHTKLILRSKLHQCDLRFIGFHAYRTVNVREAVGCHDTSVFMPFFTSVFRIHCSVKLATYSYSRLCGYI